MISRRTFLRAGAVGLPLLIGGSCAPASRPNILLIVADDLGKEGLGPYRMGGFSTPALNRLAEQGRTFTRFYVTPSCSPTRVELMTGLYPSRTGWKTNLEAQPPDNQTLNGFPTVASVLRDAGYRTAIAGKWHIGKLQRFRNHAHSLGFQRSCFSLGNARNGLWGLLLLIDGEFHELPAHTFGPDFQVAWLREFMRGPEPWFAVMMHDLPHQPLERTPISGGRFERGDKRNFPAMVRYMDKLTGDLVMPGNTLTIFCTDNGSSGLVGGGKHSFVEAGINVPLIARWPGRIPPGTRDHGLCEACDLLPTFADVAGTAAPEIDGTSMLRPLEGGQRRKPFAFAHFEASWRDSPNWAVVERRYKLVDESLYDLHLDPFENAPLTGLKNVRGRLRSIAERLTES